jgi:hypothetical protein
MSLNLHLLRLLATVVRARSFSRTAENLYTAISLAAYAAAPDMIRNRWSGSRRGRASTR